MRSEELKALLQRTQADFENFRRRAEADLARARVNGALETLLALAPIINNFRRAASHVPPELTDHEWVKGVMLVETQLEAALRKLGVEKIAPATGDQFNPNEHEALSHEPSERPADTVIETVEMGWKKDEKILKPARVRVSAGPTPQ